VGVGRLSPNSSPLSAPPTERVPTKACEYSARTAEDPQAAQAGASVGLRDLKYYLQQANHGQEQQSGHPTSPSAPAPRARTM
jgi:hypothetical protein